MDRVDQWSQYLVALYWSVMTLTTIGYGDVTAKTNPERVVFILSMFIGAGVYAYIVGAVCNIITAMEEERVAYHQRMDDLNRFCETNELQRDLPALDALVGHACRGPGAECGLTGELYPNILP